MSYMESCQWCKSFESCDCHSKYGVKSSPKLTGYNNETGQPHTYTVGSPGIVAASGIITGWPLSVSDAADDPAFGSRDVAADPPPETRCAAHDRATFEVKVGHAMRGFVGCVDCVKEEIERRERASSPRAAPAKESRKSAHINMVTLFIIAAGLVSAAIFLASLLNPAWLLWLRLFGAAL